MKLFNIRFPVGNRNAKRFGYLLMLLDDIGDDIVTERARLKDQFERDAVNAAFAFEAMENGARSEALSAKVDTLTASLVQRSSALKRQAAFIEGTRQKLALLLQRKDHRWHPDQADGPICPQANRQAMARKYRPYAIWRRLRSTAHS